ARWRVQRQGSSQTKDLRIGIALQAQLRFRSRRAGHRVVAEFVNSWPRRRAIYKWRARCGAGAKNHGDVVIVDGQRRYRRAIAPYRIVDAPPGWISLRNEITVVRDHVARNFFYSRFHYLVRQIRQRLLRWTIALRVLYKWNHAAGEICVAPPNEHKVALQVT